MIGCYIIHSVKLNKFYIGATQEDVSSRIEKHNNGTYGKHRATAKADDWVLFNEYNKKTPVRTSFTGVFIEICNHQ